MSLRRGVTWFGTLCAVVGATLLAGTGPALAVGETVRVSAASTFSAGGAPGAVSVRVSMRSGECVTVRTRIGVQLPGLTPDLVRMQVASDGAWRPVQVSQGGDGLVVSARTAPGNDELCARKSVASRYRVTLLAGAPPGRMTVLGQAYSVGGQLLGQNIDTARMTGRTGALPVPTRSAVTPSPTPEATEPAESDEPAAEPTREVAAGLPAGSKAAENSGGGFGIGTLVMLVGLVMVAIGVALLVVLIRRGRADRTESRRRTRAAAGGGLPPVDALPTAPIQRGASLYGGTGRTGPSGRPPADTGRAGAAPFGNRPTGGGPFGPPPGSQLPGSQLPGGQLPGSPPPGSPLPGSPLVDGPASADRTLILPTSGFSRSRRDSRSTPDAVTPVSPAQPAQPTSPAAPQSAPEATQRISPGVEPTQRISPGVEPTQRIGPAVEPTQRISPGVEPTQRITPAAEPTQRISSGDGPAGGVDATFILPRTQPPQA